MSTIEQIMARLGTLPRAMRWALLAAIGMVLFLVWDSAINPIKDGWKQKADELQANLAQVRGSGDLGVDLKSRAQKDLVVAFGPVEIPSSEADGKRGMTEAVNEILRAYTVSGDSFDLRQSGRLPKSSLPEIARGKRITRLRGDLRFEAGVEDALAIIAELESSPRIESISSVRLSKLSQRRLQVYLILDTWILTSGSGQGVG